MLYHLIYNNGKQSVDLMKSELVRLVDIKGVSPSAVVNTSETHSYDGCQFISSYMQKRNITILVQFRENDAEKGKLLLYQVFALHNEGTLTYSEKYRTLKINCRVEQVDCPPNVNPMTAQISLICPQPYWEAVNKKRISMQGINGMWEFPWEIPQSGFELAVQSTDRIARITNSGEVETGCIFELKARAYVKNPRLQNINTFEWIQLNTEMQAEDVIIINTIKGQKSISLIRNGVTTNIINYKVWGSTFLQLSCGLNEIVCDAEEGLTSLTIMCYMSERFGGV